MTHLHSWSSFFTQMNYFHDRPKINVCLYPLKQWENAIEKKTTQTPYNSSTLKLLEIFHIWIQESL